jgi:hypothetical protein
MNNSINTTSTYYSHVDGYPLLDKVLLIAGCGLLFKLHHLYYIQRRVVTLYINMD